MLPHGCCRVPAHRHLRGPAHLVRWSPMYPHPSIEKLTLIFQTLPIVVRLVQYTACLLQAPPSPHGCRIGPRTLRTSTQHGVHDEAGEIKIWKLGGSFAVGRVPDRAVLFARYERVEMGRRQSDARLRRDRL